MANSVDNTVKKIQGEINVIITQLKEAQEELVKISKLASQTGSSLSGIKNFSGLNQSLKQSATNTDQLNALLKEQESLERKLISTEAKLSLATESTARAVTKKNEELKILRREQRNQVKQVSELSNAYEKLSAQNNLLTREYQGLATQQKLGNKLTDEQTKRLNSLGKTIQKNQKVLKDTDAEVGRFSRNVGNYASGWDGLGNALNQLSREASAFTVSLQTGFLALSNNFPILFDEIQKLIKQNDVLAKQGLKTKSVFKQVASSFFSFNLILNAGVLALTLYGDRIIKFIGTLFKGGNQVRTFAKQQKILNETYKEGAKSASQEISQLQFLLAVAEDKTKSDKTRKLAVDKLIKSSNGLVKEQDRLNILNGKALEIENKLIKSILNKAILQQLQTKIAEDVNKLLDNQLKIRKNEADNLREIEKLRKLGLITSKDESKSIEELNKKIESRNKIRKQSTLRSIDFIAASTKATESIDKASKNIDENTKARKNNETIQKNIQALIKEALKLTDEYTLALDENTKSTVKRSKAVAIDVKTIEEQIKLISQALEIYKEQGALELKLPELEPSGLERLVEINEKATQQVSQDLIRAYNNEELKKAIGDLADTLESQLGVSADSINNFFDKITEKGIDSFDKITNVAGASFDVIGDFSNSFFESRIQQFEADIDANNEYYDRLLENEELTDQERKELEKDRQNQEKQIREKQKEEQRKQAVANKAFAIADITIKTAQSIAAIASTGGGTFFADFGISAATLTAIYSALGAAQIAAVLATPIPQFAEGGTMTHDGLMMINDHPSGRKEIVERNGQFLYTDKPNAIVKGKKGDKIHKDARETINSLTDDELIKDLQTHTVLATIEHQNYLTYQLDNKKIIDNNNLNTSRIVKAIQKNKSSFRLNNNVNLGSDLNFLTRLNNTL